MRHVDFMEKYGGDVEAAAAGRVIGPAPQAAPAPPAQETEAAAATAIMMVTAVFRPMPDPEFRADRPFVFAIWERVSRSILFVGQCVAPHDAE